MYWKILQSVDFSFWLSLKILRETDLFFQKNVIVEMRKEFTDMTVKFAKMHTTFFAPCIRGGILSCQILSKFAKETDLSCIHFGQEQYTKSVRNPVILRF